jgi:hypothetical protein
LAPGGLNRPVFLDFAKAKKIKKVDSKASSAYDTSTASERLHTSTLQAELFCALTAATFGGEATSTGSIGVSQ